MDRKCAAVGEAMNITHGKPPHDWLQYRAIQRLHGRLNMFQTDPWSPCCSSERRSRGPNTLGGMMAEECQLPLGLYALLCRVGKTLVWKFRARYEFAKFLPFRSSRAWLNWRYRAASRWGPLKMDGPSIRTPESALHYGRFSSLLADARMASNGRREEEDANLPFD